MECRHECPTQCQSSESGRSLPTQCETEDCWLSEECHWSFFLADICGFFSLLFPLNRVAATLTVSGPFCSPWGMQSLRHYEISTHTHTHTSPSLMTLFWLSGGLFYLFRFVIFLSGPTQSGPVDGCTCACTCTCTAYIGNSCFVTPSPIRRSLTSISSLIRRGSACRGRVDQDLHSVCKRNDGFVLKLVCMAYIPSKYAYVSNG